MESVASSLEGAYDRPEIMPSDQGSIQSPNVHSVNGTCSYDEILFLLLYYVEKVKKFCKWAWLY